MWPRPLQHASAALQHADAAVGPGTACISKADWPQCTGTSKLGQRGMKMSMHHVAHAPSRRHPRRHVAPAAALQQAGRPTMSPPHRRPMMT